MFANKWTALGGCLIALTFSFAPAYLFTLGVFSKAMAVEFGWSRTQISAGFSVATFAVAMFSLFAGMAVDRFGNRRVIMFAAVVLPLLLAANGFIHSFATYVVLAFLLGAVACASNPPAVLSLLPRWFERNLGMSLAVASLGIGIGGTLLPLAAGVANRHFGWRGGFFAIAAVVAVCGISNAVLFVRDRPTGFVRQEKPAGEAGISFADCIGRADYWALVLAFAIIGAVYWGAVSQFGLVMSDRGMSAIETASALSALGYSVIAGRAFGGVLLDRVPAYFLGFALFIVGSIGAVILMVSTFNGSAFLAAIMLGLALGAEGDIMAYLLRKRYGQKDYGKIFGLCFGVFNVGALVGPLILGKAFDVLRSYHEVGIGFGIVGALAALMLLTDAQSRVDDARWHRIDVR